MSTQGLGSASNAPGEQPDFPGSTNPEEQSLQVLMIEDDMQYFAFVRRILLRCSDPSFEVAGASSLGDASRHLSWESPDVILADLSLPDSDGLETLTDLRELAGGIPVVVLTGSADKEIGLQAVALGAHDYLVKHEIGNDSLVRSIRYAIERRKSEEATLRWAAIRDFTAMLAHDLKVPLMGSNTVFAALAEGEFGELKAEQAKVIGDLHKSNEDQLSLVRKLLDVYRFEASAPDLDFRSLKLESLIADCVAEISQRHALAEPITVMVQDNLPPLVGDRDALRRMLVHLLDNAVKYSGGVGRVKIQADLTGAKFVIRVHNSGRMVPTEVRSQLFQSFWRGIPGKTYVANTGLGLYFCNRIVSLHHGTITCHSTEEEGTTIRVILPTKTPAKTSKPEATACEQTGKMTDFLPKETR